jgi:DNA-binding CsgD family transcriptional regulator
MSMNLDGYSTRSGRGFAMVGRDGELALVQEALIAPPAVVLVEGEAGVGKSRLVFEAVRRLSERGVRVLTGYCHPLREPMAFGPVLDALRGVADALTEPARLSAQAGALAPLLPDLAERLPPPPPGPNDARTARFQLVGAVRTVLNALGPMVLVVEDVHWADEATRDLLLLLARDLPPQVGLVLTYRREDLPDGGAVLGTPYRRPVGTGGAEIRLDPLTRTAVDELAGTVLGSRANPTLARMLYERSGGLPLVVEEDLITLSEPAHHSRLTATSGTTSAPGLADAALLTRAEVPRGLREAVTARMRRLNGEAVALVQAAAVLAVPADRALLAAVAGIEPDQATNALIAALDAAVLDERAAARYGFRHVLAQQTIYREIPGPRRETLHHRALEALREQTPTPLVQIAHHTRALGDTEAWLEQAEAAADQALELGDEGTAAALLRDVLEQPSTQAERRARAALALSRIAVLSADYAASMAALRRILSDPLLPVEARGEVRLTLGLLMVGHAADRKGVRELERTVQEVEHVRPDLAVRAMASLAFIDDQYQRALGWLERAELAARSSSDQALITGVLANRLWIMAGHGDPAVWEMANELPRSADDPDVQRQSARGLVNLGTIALELGFDARAADLLEEGLNLARPVRKAFSEANACTYLLVLDWLAGRWAGLDERAVALCAEFPEIVNVMLVAAHLHGSLAAARGQWNRALEHLRHAAVIRRRDVSHESPSLIRISADIARIHLALDEPQAALAVVSAPIEDLRHSDVWPRIDDGLCVAVQAMLAAGEESTAHDLLAEAQKGLADADAPGATAELRMACGILQLHGGETDRAADSFDRARVMFEAIGRPYRTAHAIEHTADAHRADHPLRAAEELTRAMQIYTRLGATADAARCQRTQRQLGQSRPNPRGRRGYGTELSPRENEVARLLADAATNQDIAHALALSPRTVEHHVANVLKKLETTRTELQKSGYSSPGNTNRES